MPCPRKRQKQTAQACNSSRTHTRVVGDIALMDCRSDAMSFAGVRCFARRAFAAAEIDDDVMAGMGQFDCGRAANSRCRAGYQRHWPVTGHFYPLLPLSFIIFEHVQFVVKHLNRECSAKST